jgi:hypothetical protein
MAMDRNQRNAFIKAAHSHGWELVSRVEYGTYNVQSATRRTVPVDPLEQHAR